MYKKMNSSNMEGKNESLLTGYPKEISYECSKKIIK